MPTEMTEWLEWGGLVLSPFLALMAAMGLYNVISSSRRREQLFERDKRFISEYRTWRERVRADCGINKIICPMKLAEDEQCYAYDVSASLYLPSAPHGQWNDEILFDTECGTEIGPGWTIMDCFDSVRFMGNGSLCITDRNIYFSGAVMHKTISLDEVSTVATACSGILIGSRTMDRPMLFSCVNGARLRDTIHILLEAG